MTYPDPDVRAELEHWLVRRVDLASERALASAFGVQAVPVAVLLDGEGRVLERLVGFVEPDAFRRRLVAAREGR